MFSFYKKNIPYSDNDACKGITLDNKKSKDFKDTDCLSSIASHPRGYCFVASVGVPFDSQCSSVCDFITLLFSISYKVSVSRMKNQIYLSISEVRPN